MTPDQMAMTFSVGTVTSVVAAGERIALADRGDPDGGPYRVVELDTDYGLLIVEDQRKKMGGERPRTQRIIPFENVTEVEALPITEEPIT